MSDAVVRIDPLGYRSDVQGLRGLAVLAVVLYHANGLIPGGYVGVDMFFVISGFVITSSFRRELDTTGTISIPEFFSRRVRRILPALAVMLVATLAVSILILSPIDSGKTVGETARAASVSAANFELYGSAGYFAPVAESNPLLHTWSLSVEEQFYLVFAALVAVVVAFVPRRRLRVLGGVVVVLIGISAGLVVMITLGWVGQSFVDPQRFLFFSPLARGFEFLTGVAVAVVARRRPPVMVLTAAGAAGLAGLIASFVIFDAETVFPGTSVLLPVCATAAAIWAGSSVRWLRSGLSVRPLTWLGDVSYSWYLWHWPLIVFARHFDERLVPAAVVGSLVVAMVSLRHVEERFRSSNDGRVQRPIMIAAVSILLPLGVSSTYLLLVESGLGLSAVSEFEGRTQARERGCHADLREPILPIDQCTWPVPDPVGLVLLVGDSHAISIADAVVEAGHDEGYDVAVQTRSICPFQSRRVVRTGCANYQRETIELVRELQPEILIIANRSTAYARPAGAPPSYTVVDEADEVLHDADSALSAWSDGMHELLDQIETSAERIIIFETVPEFQEAGGRSTISLLQPGGRPESLTLEQVEARRAPTVAIHQDLARQRSLVTVVDPVPLLCSAVCSQRRDGVWTFYDNHHLSLAGARLLVPELARSIRGE